MKSPGGFPLAFALVLWTIPLGAADGYAHGLAGVLHSDPDLLSGWETWFHLSVQWLHLVAFAVWTGMTLGAALLGVRTGLGKLLLGAWAAFLVFLATGIHNMEYSTGLPFTPSILRLSELDPAPYGWPYFLVLYGKIAVYLAAVLFVFVVNVLFLKDRDARREHRLLRSYLWDGSALAIALALLASVLLLYHEAADLWPTPPHSMGGVVGPEGAVAVLSGSLPPAVPNDFALLGLAAAWMDIGVRWAHLLGFGLLLGGSVLALSFGEIPLRRFLGFVWPVLGLQAVSGVISMARWTPFSIPPYLWNLDALSHVRFGRTYTLLLAVKHALVLVLLGLTAGVTVWWMRSPASQRSAVAIPKFFLWLSLGIGLAIAYVMVMVLLVHEGVDHAL